MWQDKEVIANAVRASDMKYVFIPPSLGYFSPLLSLTTAASWLAFLRNLLQVTTVVDLDDWLIDFQVI